MNNSITAQDSIIYNPKNIHFIPTRFPTSPLQFKQDTITNFCDETLFFMHFIQQEPTTIYLVAQELSKRGWMYHNKFHTFFQLQGAAKTKTDEYLEGKFKFFYESDWIVRQKKDFKFEMKYLDTFNA